MIVATARSLWRVGCIGCTTGDILGRYTMYEKIWRQFAGRYLGDRVLSVSHSRNLCGLLGARGLRNSGSELSGALDRQSAVRAEQLFRGGQRPSDGTHCSPAGAGCRGRVLRIAPRRICDLHDVFHDALSRRGRQRRLDHGDFWRFSPSGLMLLHAKYSEVIAADGWGNSLTALLGGLGLLHVPVPKAPWHPLNKLARMNWRSYAFVVWIIARK